VDVLALPASKVSPVRELFLFRTLNCGCLVADFLNAYYGRKDTKTIALRSILSLKFLTFPASLLMFRIVKFISVGTPISPCGKDLKYMRRLYLKRHT
jgi:hypothetical protein